jgi:hypothetical protein
MGRDVEQAVGRQHPVDAGAAEPVVARVVVVAQREEFAAALAADHEVRRRLVGVAASMMAGFQHFLQLHFLHHLPS